MSQLYRRACEKGSPLTLTIRHQPRSQDFGRAGHRDRRHGLPGGPSPQGEASGEHARRQRMAARRVVNIATARSIVRQAMSSISRYAMANRMT